MKIIESDNAKAIAELRFGFVSTVMGDMLTASDACGLCFAGFVAGGDRASALHDMMNRFPGALFVQDPSAGVDVFGGVDALHLAGTAFRRRVWRALLDIPSGCTVSYSQLAHAAGMPRSVRAVASAVAANPLGVVVPCHRVVRSDGRPGEYHWGAELKCRLLEAESASKRMPAGEEGRAHTSAVEICTEK